MAVKVKCVNRWDSFMKRCTRSFTGSHKCKYNDENHAGQCVCKCGTVES